MELAIRDAVSDIHKFRDCDKFYVTLFFLFKSYGKLKTSIKNDAEAMNITYYPLPKIHCTKFVNHRPCGFTKLLHDWPALILGFENVLATYKECHGETRAKVQGILKKFNSYKFLCQVATYLNVLESIGPLSLVFLKKNMLLAHQVIPAVDLSINNLEELHTETIDNAITNFLRKFAI